MSDEEIKSITVFAIGSEVLIDGRITGRVSAIKILSDNLIQYEVIWYDDQGRHSEDLEAWELRSDNDKARKMRVDGIL